MAEIPEEALGLFLLRLNVHDLLRVKVISRQWHRVISSAAFIFDHLTFHKPVPLFCIHRNLGNEEIRKVTEIGDVVLPLPLGVSLLHFRGIVGSINGLICLDISGSGFFPSYCLWNPAIRQIRRLPNASITSTRGRTVSSIFTGFGFNPRNNEYKIVRIVHFVGLSKLVEVYSSRTNSWRGLPTPVLADIQGQKNGVLVNGDLNWTGIGKRRFAGQKLVVFFNVETEVFGVIQLDPQISGFGNLKVMSYLGLMAIVLQLENAPRLEFWVRRNGIWRREGVDNDFAGHCVPLICCMDKMALLLLNDAFHDPCAIRYGPTDSQILGVITWFDADTIGVEGFTYVESLVPVV